MTLHQILKILEWAIVKDPAPLNAIATYRNGELEKLISLVNLSPEMLIKAIHAHNRKHPNSTYIIWEL